MIEVYDDFRGNDYSTKILNHIKDFAKEKSATIITLRVDEGLGFTNRQPNKGLEKLYLKNGFKYLHTEDEVKNDETKNLGAMYFLL
jgi:GNAT superfamily N-acetyltransferase